jgi:hypothetical protein
MEENLVMLWNQSIHIPANDQVDVELFIHGQYRTPAAGTVFLLFEKTINMRSILYLIAVILVIGWLVGFFAYSLGGLIHILLVLAIISLLLGVINRSGGDV